MKILCTICARGGSKGIKNKNIRLINGKPLIAISILQAKTSRIFDCVAVSSDSDNILKIAEQYGADYVIRRPAELASDNAAKLPAIQHCAAQVEKITNKKYDMIVDLDATSPLRIIEDIEGTINLLKDSKVSNIITGTISRRSPYFNLVEINEEGYVRRSKTLKNPITRRQDSPKCYDMNASIYAWMREAFYKNSAVLVENTLLYEMPEERSIDIDNELDFQIVEYLLKKNGKLYDFD